MGVGQQVVGFLPAWPINSWLVRVACRKDGCDLTCLGSDDRPEAGILLESGHFA